MSDLGTNDIIRRHSVVIKTEDGNGTGFIINPHANGLLYIFTAYHVIKDKNGIMISHSKIDDDPSFEYTIQKVIFDEACDAAIIIVEAEYDENTFIKPCEKFDKSRSYMHYGYPCQLEGGETKDFDYYEISSTAGIMDIKHVSTEYTYKSNHLNADLKGMSGGAIIDDGFNLIGIHRKFSFLNEHDMYDKGLYVPVKFYIELLDKEGFPPILRFKFDSFAEFVENMWHLSIGARKALKGLLDSLEPDKRRIENMSPMNVFESLQNKGKIGAELDINDYDAKHWKEFCEYLQSVHLLTGIELEDGKVVDMFVKFKFIHSDEDFDIADAREKIKLKRIEGADEGTVIVVGGMKSGGCDFDVLPSDKKVVENIGRVTEGQDEILVSKGYTPQLTNLTFINCALFNDIMKEEAKAFMNIAGDEAKGRYVERLRHWIYGE